MKKILITTVTAICISVGMFGCSSSTLNEPTDINTVEQSTPPREDTDTNVEVKLTTFREQIETEAKNLSYLGFQEGYNVETMPSLEDAMNLVNTDYMENMPIDESAQILMEVSEQIAYLPRKAYNLFLEKKLDIYIAEDIGESFAEVMDIEYDPEDKEKYGGLYTADIDGKPIIFLGADDTSYALYHELGHAYDYLSNSDADLISSSDSKEFLDIYEKEKDGSIWFNMDNFENHTDTSDEYFAEAFRNYCSDIYFLGANQEIYNSMPLTMKYIDSMVN